MSDVVSKIAGTLLSGLVGFSSNDDYVFWIIIKICTFHIAETLL